MIVKIIVAHNDNNVIGHNNSIPWRNKEDMMLFKALTTNNTVVMGRKTWDSLPKKPLPNRVNIVVSRQDLQSTDEVSYVKTLQEAINHPKVKGNVYIIGGAQLYELALTSGVVDEIELSLIPGTHEGDVFFPKLSNEWYLSNKIANATFTQLKYIKYGKMNEVY